MTNQVRINLDDLKAWANFARSNGNTDAMLTLAMEWSEAVYNELVKTRNELAESKKSLQNTMAEEFMQVIAGIWHEHPDYSIQQTLRSLNEKFPEPEEEPAWWVCVTGHGNGLRRERPPEEFVQFWTPVYTRPPQRQVMQ